MCKLALWPDEYLFLFSHMRSYSTVLSHVLGSHAEICGYSETHLKYRHSADLWRLRWRVARATGAWPRGRYLLDKLLHNFMLIPRDLRHSKRLRALIFVRRPEATLRSILSMAAQHPEKGWYSSPARVAEYYCERIAWLTAVGVHLKDRALLFTSEAITNDTGSLLERISRHLDLRSCLERSYRLHRFSGVAGHGDASAKLQSGMILSGSHHDEDPSPTIDPTLIERCNRNYLLAMATLRDWCPSHGAAQQHSPAAWGSLVA
jgi:hypothetical protein